MYQHKHPKADGERAMAGMTLRMADGGFFSSLKPNFLKSGNERFAEAQAKTTSTPAQRPTMAPVTAGTRFDPSVALRQREAAAGLRDGGELRMQSGGTIPMLPPKEQTPIPDFMRRNQFKDGGEVPGEGEGDKVPALYEPGEFVVSNDMLDDAPSLRNQLHELREDTLAKRGKTVAEADEQAVGGGSLRAASGGDWVFDTKTQTYTEPSRALVPQASSTPGAGPTANAPPAAPRAPLTARDHGRNLVQSARDVGLTSRLAGAAAGAAGVAIDSAGSSMEKPTEDYYRRFGLDPNQGKNDGPDIKPWKLSGLGKDMLVRAGGVMTDLGASILDTPVDLVNAGSRLFGGEGNLKLPGGNFRDIVSRNDNPTNIAADSLRNPTPPTAAPTPKPGYTPGSVTPDPSTRSLRQGNYTVPAGEFGPEDGIVYRSGNSFSGRNISGYEGNGKNPVGVIPGVSQAVIDRDLTNPDGSRWSAADNATMAANIRDGVDPYLGTSRQAGQDRARADANIERLALSEAGTPGRRAAMKILADREQNATTLRGQDITASGQAQTARNAAASAAALKAQQDRQYELDVAKFGQEAANKKRDDKRAGDAAFDTRIKGLVGDDADGTKAAGIRTAANAFLANKMAEAEAMLKANPNNRKAASVLKDIQENGLQAFDEDSLRDLVLGVQTQQLAEKESGAWWNPFSGSAKKSSEPVKSLTLRERMILPNQYVTDKGDTIPASAVEDNRDTLRLRQ